MIFLGHEIYNFVRPSNTVKNRRFLKTKALLSQKYIYPRTNRSLISQFGLEFVKNGDELGKKGKPNQHDPITFYPHNRQCIGRIHQSHPDYPSISGDHGWINLCVHMHQYVPEFCCFLKSSGKFLRDYFCFSKDELLCSYNLLVFPDSKMKL